MEKNDILEGGGRGLEIWGGERMCGIKFSKNSSNL